MMLADNERPMTTPDLWYVTNGHAVVGPIATELLLRGIATARIPDHCMVIQSSWESWRHLHEIREISRAGRTASPESADELGTSGVPAELVTHARDAGEALLLAMHAAVTATRAAVGFVHRAREPFVGLVTSCAHGTATEGELGQVIPRFDPVLAIARSGRGVFGKPDGGVAQRVIARRFADCGISLGGVAMVPVFDGGQLLAMIEVARADHPFRREDRGILQQIARTVAVR